MERSGNSKSVKRALAPENVSLILKDVGSFALGIGLLAVSKLLSAGTEGMTDAEYRRFAANGFVSDEARREIKRQKTT